MYLSTPSVTSKPTVTGTVNPLETKVKGEVDDGEKYSLTELRAQVFELLCIVETLKRDHG